MKKNLLPIRKTRRRHNVEETRRARLQVTEVHFAEHGFAAASVREIAEAADATSPLINRYFGGKAGLYMEVQRPVNVRAANGLQRELEALGDSPQQADAVFRSAAGSEPG